MRSAIRSLVCAAFVAALWNPQVSFAQGDGDVQAQAAAHEEQAKAYYRVEAYDQAIDEFDKSYRLVKQPKLLFNIGMVYAKLGNKQRAVEFLERYTQEAPTGDAVTEARARIVGLKREIEKEASANKQSAELTSLVASAKTHIAAKQYDKAIAAFDSAYKLGKDPEMLFEIADAYRLKKDYRQAIVYFETYVADPNGARGVEARRLRQDIVDRLEAAARAEEDRRAAEKTAADRAAADKAAAERRDAERRTATEAVKAAIAAQTPAETVAKKSSSSGTAWGWIAVGVAMVGAGVAADNIPRSGRDGQLQGSDFVPLGLYGLGLTAVLIGVF